MSVPNSRAIWNRVRPSARRVSAKRAPISGKVGSGFVYIKCPAPSPPFECQHTNQLLGSGFHQWLADWCKFLCATPRQLFAWGTLCRTSDTETSGSDRRPSGAAAECRPPSGVSSSLGADGGRQLAPPPMAGLFVEQEIGHERRPPRAHEAENNTRLGENGARVREAIPL
jgi:hypothetical protein